MENTLLLFLEDGLCLQFLAVSQNYCMLGRSCNTKLLVEKKPDPSRSIYNVRVVLYSSVALEKDKERNFNLALYYSSDQLLILPVVRIKPSSVDTTDTTEEFAGRYVNSTHSLTYPLLTEARSRCDMTATSFCRYICQWRCRLTLFTLSFSNRVRHDFLCCVPDNLKLRPTE